MNSFFEESMFAGVALSLIAYALGSMLKKKFKLGVIGAGFMASDHNPVGLSVTIEE